MDRYDQRVSADAHALLRKALALPDDERAGIATELIASLDEQDSDDPASARELWTQEIERRARRVAAGESGGEDWESVRQRLTDGFAGG